MEMKIYYPDIIEFINGFPIEEQNEKELKENLYFIYQCMDEPNQKYVINKVVENEVRNNTIRQKHFDIRKMKLKELKKLKLPEQRSKEWYAMRKNKLTASSIASAINKCHFTSRDELLLSKIEEKPYESNDITEWGVKYEDIAIAFYEELYNVKVLDFGLVPHPVFEAFGASPDGICDDTGNDEYVARMVEIKCPPKRKFTKTVPSHYLMQVQGQLEVCDLDQCDFFQVKIEEYNDLLEYEQDIFINDDVILPGRTHLNYPKGVTLSYRKKDEMKLTYLYPPLNLTIQQYKDWIQENKLKITYEGHEFVENKWWKISRYECSLVDRDTSWWIKNVDKILDFYNDLLLYRNNPTKLEELKNRIIHSKKNRKIKQEPLNDFVLISDEEDN